MPTIYPAPGLCPVCGGVLTLTRLECGACQTRIEGHFDGGGLARLDPEQLAFVEVFVRNRGVIKDVEVELGLSYPTIRSRLDEVVRALGASGERPRPSRGGIASRRERRRQILQQLRDRAIGPDDAARLLATLDQEHTPTTAPRPSMEEER